MKRLLSGVLIVLLAAVLGISARYFLFSTVRIAGTSMQDTLLSGDIALVWKTDRTPDYGEIIECRFPDRDGSYTKRVIGLPGDTIECTGGTLVRNGIPVSEPYVSSPTEDFQISVGEAEIFVMGDNRSESNDSRAEDMGCISAENGCLGRVCWILWPINRFGPVE